TSMSSSSSGTWRATSSTTARISSHRWQSARPYSVRRIIRVPLWLTPRGTSSTDDGFARQDRRTLSFMSYAVIRTGGKQYRVSPGDLLRIERLAGEVGAPVEFTEVLLAAGDGAVRVGTPLVEGVCVRGQILAQGRARKILVFKKKRRKNYRRRRGHRQSITTVRVMEIA